MLHPHNAFGAEAQGYMHKRHKAIDVGASSSVAPSAAPSPARPPSAASLPFSSVTLSLAPFRTTVSGSTAGGAKGNGRVAGRTNTHVLWTPEEDACLRALVEDHGEQAWALVASRMPHERNNKQCRERWRNHLRPACNKGPWTEAEDALILERVQQHGTKWAKISGLYLPDRPENDIKNRWHIVSRPCTHAHTRIHAPPPCLAASLCATPCATCTHVVLVLRATRHCLALALAPLCNLLSTCHRFSLAPSAVCPTTHAHQLIRMANQQSTAGPGVATEGESMHVEPDVDSSAAAAAIAAIVAAS